MGLTPLLGSRRNAGFTRRASLGSAPGPRSLKQGAQHLIFPGSSLWWLDHYPDFRRHLKQRYRAVLWRNGPCVIFELTEKVRAKRSGALADPTDVVMR